MRLAIIMCMLLFIGVFSAAGFMPEEIEGMENVLNKMKPYLAFAIMLATAQDLRELFGRRSK